MSKNRYWTTLSEFDHDPEVEKLRGEEFLAKPEEYFQALKKGGLQFGRRDFLKWSTGALALATTACTRKPAEKIIPYAQQPPELIPGVANFYASTCRECSAGCGILLRTREGRPVKVEGNPLHPVNRGGVCARGQSALLNLYDPDRLRTPVQLQRDPSSTAPLTKIKGEGEDNNYFPPHIWDTGEDRSVRMAINVPLKELSWDEADQQIAARLGKSGAKVVLLTGTIHGPARTQLISDFAAATGAHHVTYDGLNPDALVAAQQASYGTPVVPRFFFDKAEMVVTFGADPLGSGISKVEYLRGYGELRKLRTVNGNAQMSRLVSFEPAMTMTGMNADSRYLVQPQFLLPVALGVAHQIVLVNKQSKFAGNAQVARALATFTPDAVETAAGLEKGTIAQVAAALWKNRGQSLIWATGVPGATDTQQQLEIVAAFLNAALENEGVTVDGTGSVSQQAQGTNAAMLSLVQAMRNKAVDVLIVYGTNPAFTLPAGAGFREALANVPYVVTISDRLDETALLSNVALPALHGMESWGDAEPQKGLYGLVQPTIDPLFNGRSFEDSLMSVARVADPKRFVSVPAAAKPVAGAAPAPAEAPKPLSFYEYLRQHWQNEIYAKNNVAGSFDDFWTGALRQGFFDPNAQQRLKPGSPRSFNAAALASLPASLNSSAASGDTFTLVLTVDPMIGDGAQNNNAFLLEIPDPVSKIDWDNYLSIAPKSAKRLGLQEGDLVEITVGDATVKVPLHLQPAIHPNVVTLGLGWGRRAAGQIGAGIGVDTFPLTQITKAGLVYSGAQVQLKKVGSGYTLTSPQGNNYINYQHDWVTPEKEQRGEEIIHEATLVQIQTNPRAGNESALEKGNNADLWYLWDGKHNFPRHHWGMTVDLNSCTGCNACVVACYAENNIPVVGKDQVWRGRSMEWIRIDRYFADSETENPTVTNQPMMCQQCGNAGCESVCPVLATVTNDEGLNVQVYNRCVGTRFCSNNCVYKARRFNFYEYSRVRSSPLELALNPDVTVRSMGVMEKCTFCVQRINDGEKRAQALGVPVKDGDIKTACQQTCPSQAIYFGDMNDEKSAMMQARTERSYGALEFLNFRPSVSYLTKIRNVEEQA